MIDLKRSIQGVAIHADTDDPAKAERVKRAVDAAMRAMKREQDRARRPEQPSLFDLIFGSHR